MINTPSDNLTKISNPVYDQNGPYGSQSIYDEQIDDEITEKEVRLTKQFEELRKIILPEQRSPEWYEMRYGKFTASDIGTLLGLAKKYSSPYTVIIKKLVPDAFTTNMYCYHGKKYETVATLIYKHRMNVSVDDFGLIGHPVYSFLGASPDGICNKYKLDGIHLSKYVGRMLEIKCPVSRDIKTEGEVVDGICPHHYWAQVQLQLECCDLDECDFWQCSICEYDDEDMFLFDTNDLCQYKSDSKGFEKGCIIELMPESVPDTIDSLYDNAAHIYPDKIDMTPEECEIWLKDKISNIPISHPGYRLHRTLYWYLAKSCCVTIKRDKQWFNDNLPFFKKMWDYVVFFRNNQDAKDKLLNYVDNLPRKINSTIMKYMESIYNQSLS